RPGDHSGEGRQRRPPFSFLLAHFLLSLLPATYPNRISSGGMISNLTQTLGAESFADRATTARGGRGQIMSVYVGFERPFANRCVAESHRDPYFARDLFRRLFLRRQLVVNVRPRAYAGHNGAGRSNRLGASMDGCRG